MNATIIAQQGAWIYYPEEDKWGYKISVENEVAKALMKDQSMNTKYAVVDDGLFIQLKNGLYKIADNNLGYYYGFDSNGKMLTGFIHTTEDTKMYGINVETQDIIFEGYAEVGKYYLMETGAEMGMLWNQPITLNNITYIFEVTGKIIEEIQNIIDGGGAWVYDEAAAKYKYNIINADGTTTFAKDGVYAIPAINGIYYYIFDADGYMKTGVTEHNGKTYYLQETGLLQGTVYTGDIILDNKVYSFSSTTGQLINVVDAAQQVVPII